MARNENRKQIQTPSQNFHPKNQYHYIYSQFPLNQENLVQIRLARVVLFRGSAMPDIKSLTKFLSAEEISWLQ